MFTLPSSVRIYVASEASDLRRGFDGLSALTRSVIGENPMSGHLFVFLNRRRNRIKVLAWDRTGYVVLYKRLERGTFRIPVEPKVGEAHVQVDSGELTLMLEGLDLRNARRQRRWYRR
jgi:transposase